MSTAPYSPHASVRLIASEAAEAFGVTAQDVLGESRRQHVARARFAAAWLARRRLGYSLPRIGMAFHRDHTSILHAIRRCEEMRANDPEYREITDGLAGEPHRCPRCGGAVE